MVLQLMGELFQQIDEEKPAVLANTFGALEDVALQALQPYMDVFAVGPAVPLSKNDGTSELAQIHLFQHDETAAYMEWLDAQPRESVFYVGFGSLACMTPRDLAETAWGIAGSGVPFLWVVRPGLVRGPGQSQQQLPERFEAVTRGRGMVVAWAPQEEVLRHRAVGGFWTHNGWNSTMESVCEGVPMLYRPCFGDQMGDTRYVEHVWRVGFEVGGDLERGIVEAAVRRLMTGVR